MITVYNNKSYRITYDGVSMVENALGNPNMIQISVAYGCEILVAPNQYGVAYMPNGDFRKWYITSPNPYLNRTEAHHIYVKLSRDGSDGMIVFSVNDYDFDGKIIGDSTSVANETFFYQKIGSITATDTATPPTIKREISYDGGYLNTPQYNEDAGGWREMFSLTTDNLINALKHFASFTVKGTLYLVGKLVLNNKTFSDIARSVDEENVIDDETLPTTKYLREKFAEETLRDLFLNKDRLDSTDFLQKFLGGINIGEAIDSLTAGKGTIADNNGRIQADRMELRSSLTVLELIFNRLSAMESDYSFSESGTIDRVELLEDGTYNLPLRKRWDNDFTALAENDVVYGIVNDLASGGGNYYTSWLRILHVDTAANTVNAVLYPDSEVPGGKNYPPEPLMMLSHRGNPVDTDRQGYWYLSSGEHCICMLDGVTKPILEERNYAVIVGRLKNLSIFDNLPINYLHSYIYCRGIAIQDILRIDYEGVPIVQHNDRGFWTATPDTPYSVSAMSVDVVWHVGCKWLCLMNGTTAEPMYGSIGWAMLEGNPEFSIEIDSSEGWTFDMDKIVALYENGQLPFTTLNITGKLYNGDVTSHILDGDIEWARDSGDVTEDNAWTSSHADSGKVLAISLNDLGPSYSTMTGCKFKARALLRDGQTMRSSIYEVEF